MLQQCSSALMARLVWQQATAGSSLNVAAIRVLSAAAPVPDKMALIKALRERTSAPISDVQKCLTEAKWDSEAAYELLRKKGLAAAAKKASRQATEGLVGLSTAPGIAAIVEVNSETDFVARNDKFTGLVQHVSQAVLALGARAAASDSCEVPLDKLQAAACPGSGAANVGDAVTGVAATVRENVKLRRGYVLASPSGVVSTYVHMSVAPGLGRIATAVALEAEGGSPIPAEARPQLEELGSGLAMHVAGMRPQYVSRDAVPAEAAARERAVLAAAAASMQPGKSQAVLDKMAQGRLGKWYQDVCLLEQKYVLDDSLTVKALVDKRGKELGVKGLHVARMLRVQCGEGLQADRTDFAAEVASMAK